MMDRIKWHWYIWVALGESFHLCRLKHHKNSKPQTEKKTLSPTEEGRIRWELIVFALTPWELKKARCQKTFSLLVRPFVEGSFFSIPSFRRMGQTKKTKCLAAKNAFFLILFSNQSIVFQIHHVLTDKRWQLPLWFLLGTLSKSLRRPLLRRSWMRSPGESTSP